MMTTVPVSTSIKPAWVREEGAARTAAELPPKKRYALAFFFFIVLNAVLFIRPSEIFPALEGLPIYNVVIIACILFSLPALVRQLRWSYLRSQPTTLFVIALIPIIIISLGLNHLSNQATQAISDMSKPVIYFLLLTALVNTPKRLGKFLATTVVFIITIAAIASLNYHHIINVESIKTEDRVTGWDEDTGDATVVEQLYGPGIFNDPNDFSLILSASMLLLLHCAMTSRRWMPRLGYFAVMVIPGYAFAMTRSRGGFLSLAAGTVVLAVSRYGWKKSIPLVGVALPVMLVLFSGRMTNVNLDQNDTAQGRMMLWRDGFALLRHSPVFGIGWNTYADQVGLVAHNSFVHIFTELGLIGGVAFTSMFYIPITVVRKRRQQVGKISAPEALLDQWRPGVLAILCGYAIGLCTLSRMYIISTYMIIGIGAAYCAILAIYRPADVPKFNGRYFWRLFGVGIGCILFFNIFIRVF